MNCCMARKAAKRARYAAELFGKGRNVKRYKRIQSVLGDHQDTVVAAGTLRRMALTAGMAHGENGFTFGLLYAREQHLAAECRPARDAWCNPTPGTSSATWFLWSAGCDLRFTKDGPWPD